GRRGEERALARPGDGDRARLRPDGRPGGRARSAGMSVREMTTLEAMIDALRIEMRRDPSVIYLGEGTGERGGTYGHTLGLFAEFGPERMIDTPISELGFTGAAIG